MAFPMSNRFNAEIYCPPQLDSGDKTRALASLSIYEKQLNIVYDTFLGG
jgi:hypothetical protein